MASRVILRRSLWLVLAGLVVAVPIFGCSTLRQISFAVRTTIRESPDYDTLEADRAAEAAEGEPRRSSSAWPAPYWTGFRGPARDGVYAERDLALPWPAAGPEELWKRPIGGGLGSVAVADGLVLTLEQRREREALVAYDLETGAEVWVHDWEERFDELMSGEGPRSTPVVADGLVYAHGAAGELRCVRAADGELRWRRNVLEDHGAENLEYGLSGTPLLVDDAVLVTSGGPALAAYDRDNGEPLWSALPEPAAYASPVRATVAGRDQLLFVTSSRVVGLDVDGGELLWEYPWDLNGPACCEAFPIGPNDLFVSAGYGHGSVRLSISEGPDGLEAEGLWRSRRLRTRFNPVVVRDGHAYGFDESTLVCIELESGRRVWKGERYGYGQLLLAGDHLVAVIEEGDLILVSARPDAFEELSRVPAIEGITMNVPALAHGLLIVRNDREMACYDLR